MIMNSMVSMEIKRCNFLPEGEMAIIKDTNTLIHNIVNSELKEKDKEIERLKNGIKELDDMFYETFRISQNGYFSISEWELKDFTDKLKELKEGKE